jgi:hypothetical protein
MEYAVEVGSVVVLHIPRFVNIGSAIQKLVGATHICRQHGDRISLNFICSN